MALSEKQIELLDKAIADKMPKGGGDKEADHLEADWLLIEALTAAGFHRVAEAWKLIEKWYG
jgi:hypothetical protein